MRWSKLKNIIILLLIMVNLFLLVQEGVRYAASVRYQNAAREEAVLLLKEKGVQVTVDPLPEDPALSALRCERAAAGELSLAQALLGDAAQQEDGSYAGALGALWFYSSGGFSAEFTGQAYLLDGQDPAIRAKEVMSRLDFDGELLSVQEDGDSTVVQLRQCWQGTPIFSCDVTLTWRGGALRSIQGRRLPGVPTAVEGESSMTVTTVLIRFLGAVNEGYVRSEIRGLTAGYEMQAVPSGSTFLLTPVWEIETDASPLRLDSAGVLTPVSDPAVPVGSAPVGAPGQ